LNKQDDYKRCLDKQVDAIEEAKARSARGKRDVAPLEAQAKNGLPTKGLC
jgi:hypothetical protein